MEPAPVHEHKEPENLELKSWLNCSLKTESLAPHLIDEIALEGLDGITLQALQRRLIERPGMTLPITDKSMIQIWNVVRRIKGIDFYALQEPRGDLVLYRRADYMDERGNLYEPLSAPEDLYQYHPIDVPGGTIRGSCPTFCARKRVLGIENWSLEYVKRTFGSRLVLVACQKFRERAMLGSDVEGTDNLTIIQYCMLERIARGRYEGEITKGNVSLNTMKIDPKSLFYQRKYLLRKKMIRKQVFSMKFGKNRTTSLISILHIPRFYTPAVPLAIKNARLMIAYLSTKPQTRVETADVKKKFGKTVYRALLSKEFEALFKEIDVPLAVLNPEGYAKERRPDRKEAMLKRTQKVFVYLNPPGGPEPYLPQLKEQESRGGDPKSETNIFLRGIVYRPQLNLFDTPLHQTQMLITSGGSEGIALKEIADGLRMHSLAARSGGRFAVRLKYAKTNLVEKKKTKVHKYIFTGDFHVPHTLVKPLIDVSTRQIQKIMPTHAIAKEIIAREVQEQRIMAREAELNRVSLLPHHELGFTLVDGSSRSELSQSIMSEENSSAILGLETVPPSVVPSKSSRSEKRSRGGVELLGRRRKRRINAEEILLASDSAAALLEMRETKGKFARLLLGKPENGTILPPRPPKPRKKRREAVRRPRIVEGVYYDEKDKEALAKKIKQRVSWTVQEDQIILLLFISSVVFIPKYNLKKLFIFNATQIRDLLHLKNEESRSKTSLAIRRRMHFLIKNPSFKSKYTYYLYDAVQDENIHKMFQTDCEEIVAQSPKIFYEIPSETILKAYDYLLQKHGGEISQVPRSVWESRIHSADITIDEVDDSESYQATTLPGEEGETPESGKGGPTDGIMIEEIECWAYDSAKQVMVDASKDPIKSEEVETWVCRNVVFSLMFSGDSLDDVQPFLERFGDENLEFISNNCRRLAICSISRRSHKFGLSSTMRRRLINHLHPNMYRFSHKFLQEGVHKFCPTNPNVSSNTASLFLIIEFLMGSNIQFKIHMSKECTKEALTQEDEGYQPFGLRAQKKIKNTTATTKSEEESAVVNLPSVQTKLEFDARQVCPEGEMSPGVCFQYLSDRLLIMVPREFKDDFLDLCDKGNERAIRFAPLYLMILQAKDLGISLRLLMTKFTKASLKGGLEFLLTAGYIYLVGVTQRKVVATKYIDRWTMRIPMEKDNRISLQKVIIHPWITSGGRINWELIDRLFTAIIGVLYKHPGIQFRQAVKCLTPVISGMELATLLQAMLHFKFLNAYKFVRSHQPGIGTERTTFFHDDDVDPFLEIENLHFELKPFVTTKYTRLQTIFHQETNNTVTFDDSSDASRGAAGCHTAVVRIEQPEHRGGGGRRRKRRRESDASPVSKKLSPSQSIQGQGSSSQRRQQANKKIKI